MLRTRTHRYKTEPYYPSVIDIETAPDGTDIGMGMAWYDDINTLRYNQFNTIKEWYYWYVKLLDSYSDKKYKRVNKRLRRLFAHNGANFDDLKIHQVTALELEEVEYAQYFLSGSNGIGYKCKYKSIKGEVAYMDSYRLLPSSLKELSKTFGIVQGKIDLEGLLPHEVKEQDINLFWEYLKHDCVALQEILYKFWLMLYNKHGDFGELPMTLPSLGIRLFCLYLDDALLTPKSKYQKQLERRAYHGGLTQCLYTGEYQNISVYDVNSMYPYAMDKYQYPMSYEGYVTDKYEPDSIGLWEVSFVQNRHDIPPFIFNDKDTVAYEGEAVCTTHELNHLLEIGGTFTLHKGRVWVHTGPLFKKFIDDFYTERKEASKAGNKALAYVLKILMNSVYGKFAEREQGYKLLMATADQRIAILDSGGTYYNLGDFIAILEDRVVPHSFVGLAALITAYARIELHTIMVRLIDKGKRVLYCDTDSIHAVDISPNDVDIGDNLGQVKLEYQGAGVYAGKKLYALAGKEPKAKGIGRQIKTGNLTYNRIRDMALDRSVKEAITFSVFPTVKEVLSGAKPPAVMFNRTRTIGNTGSIFTS